MGLRAPLARAMELHRGEPLLTHALKARANETNESKRAPLARAMETTRFKRVIH